MRHPMILPALLVLGGLLLPAAGMAAADRSRVTGNTLAERCRPDALHTRVSPDVFRGVAFCRGYLGGVLEGALLQAARAPARASP